MRERKEINTARVTGVFVKRAEDRPVRLTRRGRRHRPSGVYFSVKCGYGVPWESRNELHSFWSAEVDSNVLRYRAQPHTLEMVIDGRRHHYTPDRQDWMADGRIEIIEIKDTFDRESDDLYAEKIRRAEAIYVGLGFRFRVIARKEIEREPAFRAVQTIQFYRRAQISPQAILHVQRALSLGQRSLGDVVDAIGPTSTATCQAYAMIVRRLLGIDLSNGLSRSSAVWAI